MTAPQARNHHWVPQCYLKGFSKSPSKNAKLYVIDKLTKTSFLASPRNVASSRDFNRVEAPGVAPDHIESEYASFESLVGPALRRMADTGTFGAAEDLNLVLNLIALLAVRTPRMRENIRDFHERVARQIMGLTVATKERYELSIRDAVRDGAITEPVVEYEAMKDFIDRGAYTVQVGTTHHVGYEIKLADTLLPLLAARTWTLIRALPGTSGFVTSDHPVALQWLDEKPPAPFHPPGFGLRDTEVLFPVSHDLLMVGEFGGAGGMFEANQQQVAFANGALIWHATRQIYARDDRFVYCGRDGALRRGGDLLGYLRS